MRHPSIFTEPEAPGSQTPSRASFSQRVKRRLGAILAALFSAVKWGALLLSKFKFAGVLLSMLVSVGAYTLLWGWEFAVGFVLMLLVHEYGHVIQLRREGVAASAPTFIPFVGAFISMRGQPRDAAMEARVGLAGPVAGSVAALAVLGVYAVTGAPLWRALAYFGFFLQLFNLAPMLPLDGGRAMAAISTKVWALGFVGMLALAVYTLAPIMFLIVLLGGLELSRRYRARNHPDRQAYHQVPWRQRVRIGAVYLCLVLGCGFAAVRLYQPESIGQALAHHAPHAQPAGTL